MRTLLVIICALLALNLVATKPYPVAIFHGFGDFCKQPGMASFTQKIGEKLGTYAACIEIGNGSLSSIVMEFDKQAKIACNNLIADNNFNGPISVIGLSQGSLIARYISQSCEFNGVVQRMVTLGGPHMGVANVPNCHSGIFCNGLNFIARTFVYARFFQSHIGPAGYFRNPKNLGKYLQKSVFLPDLNNERNFSVIKKDRFLQLEKLMLIKFDQDTMIDPKETAWFGFYAEDGKTVVGMKDQEIYKSDLIGLKQLYQEGKVTLIALPGQHLEFGNAEIDNFVIPQLI